MNKRNWIKWGVMAACLCLAIGLGLQINKLNNRNTGPFGNGDATISKPHREDFSPTIENSVLKQFDNDSEVKKAYILRTNDWFLSDGLSDFSQAITTDIIYVASGTELDAYNGMAHSFYNVTEDGKIEWDSSVYPPEDASVPFGFAGLTYEMIENALADIEYEDYIITYAQRWSTVLIWARSNNEDMIITYPTRPDLLGIDTGGVYTLKELQAVLSASINR